MDQSADSIRGGKRINAARAVGAGAVAAAPPAAGGIAPEAPTRPPAARKSGAANPAPASPAGGGGGAKASVPAAVPPAELSAPAPPPASPGEQSEEASPQKIRVLPIASSLAEDRELDERTQLLAVFRLGIVAALIWGYVWMRRRFVRHPG